MNRIGFSVTKFSTRLKELRIENGLTLEELCNRLAMKYDYSTNKGVISKYENGKHEPNLYFVDIVSDLFGVSMDYLSGKSDIKQQSECLPQCKYIPIIGTIAAGAPVLAQQNIEGYECINDHLKADHCLKVKGDSMVDAGIKSGDIVYIHSQSDVESGEIAVVLVDGEEATLRKPLLE